VAEIIERVIEDVSHHPRWISRLIPFSKHGSVPPRTAPFCSLMMTLLLVRRLVASITVWLTEAVQNGLHEKLLPASSIQALPTERMLHPHLVSD
jgi:hypothetical protein